MEGVEIAKILQAYKLPLALGGGSVFVIILSIILLVKSIQPAQAPIEFSSDTIASRSAEIKVDIEGAVVHPGLYSLPEGGRVEDAITAAGGLAGNVDNALFSKTINRAMKLIDGAKLFIPSKDDTSHNSNTNIDTGTGYISINFATESELDTLSGVGPVTAQKIISNRPYQTLEELVSKKAVGAALFGKIKDKLSL